MYTDTSKTTFIPKAPVTSIQQPTSISGNISSEKISHGMGFIGWIGLLILVATIISSVGLFLYVGYFQSQRLDIISSLKKKQETVDTKFIAEAQRLSARISFTEDLLSKQVYVSPLFDALHQKTLPTIQFDTFTLKEKTATDQSVAASGTGKYQAVLNGKAKSYEVIAQQSDVYATSDTLKTHFFSNFTIDTQTNLIGFTLTIDVPESLGHAAILDAEKAQNGEQGVSDTTQSTSTSEVPPVPAQ